MIVAIQHPPARPIDTTTFADITSKVCTSVAFAADDLEITFATDLTATEKIQVRVRCATADATAETVLLAAVAAYTANQAYLAIGTPTTAQAVAQVAAVTRQMQFVFRAIAPLD